MKQSPLKDLKNGLKMKSFYRIKNKEQEETNGHRANFLWGEKAQSWLGIWGLADGTDCVSCQVDHSQGHQTYLNFGYLMQHFG